MPSLRLAAERGEIVSNLPSDYINIILMRLDSDWVPIATVDINDLRCTDVLDCTDFLRTHPDEPPASPAVKPIDRALRVSGAKEAEVEGRYGR